MTSSKKMADDIGELLIKVGRRPSYHLQKGKGIAVKHKNGVYIGNHDIWIVSECYSKYHTLQSMDIKLVDYHDMVHCVELEKNHTLLVRRNGQICWCGNCGHVLMPYIPDADEVISDPTGTFSEPSEETVAEGA